jgi:hypothetical protein
MGIYRVHLLDRPDEHIVKAHILQAQDDYAAYHEPNQYPRQPRHRLVATLPRLSPSGE